MAQLLEFRTDSGEAVFVEAEFAGGIQPLAADGSDIIKKVSETFDAALAGIQHAATALIENISKIRIPADTIEMELGVKASAKAGFYLASADSQAQIKVKLVWHRKRESTTVVPLQTA